MNTKLAQALVAYQKQKAKCDKQNELLEARAETLRELVNKSLDKTDLKHRIDLLDGSYGIFPLDLTDKGVVYKYIYVDYDEREQREILLP